MTSPSINSTKTEQKNAHHVRTKNCKGGSECIALKELQGVKQELNLLKSKVAALKSKVATTKQELDFLEKKRKNQPKNFAEQTKNPRNQWGIQKN